VQAGQQARIHAMGARILTQAVLRNQQHQAATLTQQTFAAGKITAMIIASANVPKKRTAYAEEEFTKHSNDMRKLFFSFFYLIIP
jgi:hypothetical protein